ncbi:MAG TPA: hypothetical protein VFJ43_09225 [Bacteroidia bacterium]|nr:hypothetical protein [Bacteroidia bacterium]
MKKIAQTIMVAAIAATISIAGCKKEDTPSPTSNPTQSTGSISSLNAFFAHQGAQSQFFTIDNNSVQAITGAHGTVLTFNANSFVTQLGGPVTGNITIELKEIYSKKDMLLSNVSTNAELYPSGPNDALISGGEFYVSATQGNAPLKLAPGQTYGAFLPSATTPNPAMSLFHGGAISNGILWGPADSSSTLYASSAPSGYFATCDSIYWGNADCFLSAPNYTTINMNIGGTFDASQIKAYVWYDNSNVVWSCWTPFNSLTNVYSDNHTATGVPVHLIVISVKNGLLYTSVLATTVTANAVYNITMTQTDETTFTNLMSTLP